MRKINIRFERDPELREIEVLIRAPERDAETEALLERIRVSPADTLTAADESGALVPIAPEKIVSVSVNGNIARIETETGSYTVRQTLQSIEQALAGGPFLRISRSELVNMDKVEKYDFTVSGALRLELTGGIETWAARRCIPEIRRRIKGKG